MSLTSRRKLWSFFDALFSQELTDESPKVATPAWIKTPLLPHQQSAVAKALQIEKAKKFGIQVNDIAGDPFGGRMFCSHGILGDRVGSGKSLTALSLVKMPAPENMYSEYIVRGGQFQGDGRDVGLLRNRLQHKTANGTPLIPLSTSLFIIPHALINQWEDYVNADTTLKAQFIKRRKDAENEDLLKTIESYDALFVSSTMWSSLRNVHPIRTYLWKRVFIDEADSINITTDYDEIHGLFYWFISASWLNLVFSSGSYFNIETVYIPPPETPESVIERVGKLQNGYYLSVPGCKHMNIVRRMCGIPANNSTMAINSAASQSARLIIHSSEEYIRQSFTSPHAIHREILCATPANIRVLDSFISPEMMERLHAGDIHGALDIIGMNTFTESEITSAVTESLTNELEQARKIYEFKKTIEYSTPQLKTKALEACEAKIASIESRISAIKERIERSSQQTCPICYCDVTNPCVTPCCNQLFCFPCLCESLKRVSSCPLCRVRINDLKELKVVGSTTAINTVAEQPKKLNKKDSFIKFLQDNPTAKVLMFSGYDASFSGLEAKMSEHNIQYTTVSGSQARITKILKEFREGKYNVLFLNARNMGSGLNIESATHVVLFHRMSAELEEQIIGRAMRLGRKSNLDVIHLLHENEITERISHV